MTLLYVCVANKVGNLILGEIIQTKEGLLMIDPCERFLFKRDISFLQQLKELRSNGSESLLKAIDEEINLMLSVLKETEQEREEP